MQARKEHKSFLALVANVALLLATLAVWPAEPCEAAARLIKVPLQRATTQGAGDYGQPVISYYTPVNIGTPPKTFNIQFDVDFGDHFVPHYSWNPFNRNLHYSNGFQCKVSSTCSKDKRELTIDYEHVALTGKRYEDQVVLLNAHYGSQHNPSNGTLTAGAANNTHFALSNGLQSNTTKGNMISWRQKFLAISSASTAKFQSLPVDGFFGLSANQQSSQAGLNGILSSLHSAHLIDNLQFGLWINPILDSTYGGELTLGGIDTNRYQGQIYWHHLTMAPNQAAGMSSWSLSLQYVGLGQQVVSCAGLGCQAVFSSAQSDIYGPRADVQSIYRLLNTVHQSNGVELIDCRRMSSLPILTFNIDGIPYALLPSNYIRKTLDGVVFKTETCYVAILPQDGNGRLWTLGTNFLGAYYTMFDVTYRQMGFASLR